MQPLQRAHRADGRQERNIEAGVLIDDTTLAARVTRQFDHFVEAHLLEKLVFT